MCMNLVVLVWSWWNTISNRDYSIRALWIKKCYKHVITMTSWSARWRLKSPASPLFTVYSGADQRNIEAPSHWPLCWEFTAQMASNAENVSMTSSWFRNLKDSVSCASLHGDMESRYDYTVHCNAFMLGCRTNTIIEHSEQTERHVCRLVVVTANTVLGAFKKRLWAL